MLREYKWLNLNSPVITFFTKQIPVEKVVKLEVWTFNSLEYIFFGRI